MPSTDVPIADLGSSLWSLLLASLLWVTLAALLVGLGCWLLASRHSTTLSRARQLFMGDRLTHRTEPNARRFLRLCFGGLWIVDGLLQAQPKMPGGFLPGILEPQIAAGPSWFANLVGPLARTWLRHPVAADAATVWVQIGLGLLMVIGGRGLLAKISLWGAIAWSAAVWSFGEAFGGLLAPGASWLSGAPGAVLVYAAAAGLLLFDWDKWDSGQAQLIARRITAGWFLSGAVLHALPVERMWTAAGIADPFISGAHMSQPRIFASPIARLANLALDHPVAVNVAIIVLLSTVGIALWISDRRSVFVAGLALCAMTWWLAQDFGVLGGTATDPNSALPLGLLLGCTRLRRSAVPAQAPARDVSAEPRLQAGLAGALATLAVGLTLAVPAALVATLASPADAAAVAADSDGGLRAIPLRPAVNFSLTDQRGRPVSTRSLTGKLVLLTFLDPVCTSDCPLIANQLAIADRELGPLAKRVEFVAIDTNPVFHFKSDVAAFTDSHGLGGYTNWHFLYGSTAALTSVITAYGISVDVPAVGMIQHSEGMYFINSDGRQVAYLDDGAGQELTRTYAEQVRDEIRNLLK